MSLADGLRHGADSFIEASVREGGEEVCGDSICLMEVSDTWGSKLSDSADALLTGEGSLAGNVWIGELSLVSVSSPSGGFSTDNDS